MLDTELCSSRVLSPFRGEIGDEDLAVLPRHTKVIVTGNNRTKSVLVGLQGVVKKAVGLGGWHWLVLKNGVEVKLQRNALSVLEPPTGNEEDSDDGLDNSSCSSDAVVRDNLFSASGIEFPGKSKPRIRYSKPWIQSTSTKLTNQSCVKEVQGSTNAPKLTVNFRNLGMNSLWRYCRRYKLKTPSHSPSKEQMIHAVQQHFAAQKQLDEVKVITEFISAAKRLKTTERGQDRE